MLLQGTIVHKYWAVTDYSLILYIWPYGSLDLDDGIVVKVFDGMTLSQICEWTNTFLMKHSNINIDPGTATLINRAKEVSTNA